MGFKEDADGQTLEVRLKDLPHARFVWRERFLVEQNQRAVAIFADQKKTPTERFWAAEKEMNAIARILTNCFDGHSRSNLEMHLLLMCRHKIIRDDDLGEFSGELKERFLRIVSSLPA